MASRSSVVGSEGSPPQSVEKITRIAQDYEYNAAVPLRYWLRTAATLVREVSNAIGYLSIGDRELMFSHLTGTNLRTRRTRRTSIPPPFSTRPAGSGEFVKPPGRLEG